MSPLWKSNESSNKSPHSEAIARNERDGSAEVSSETANKLMNAESIAAFLRSENGDGGWQIVSSLKSEVDRLVGCDLNLASRLVDKIEQLAIHLDDPLSKAFAEASRARLLHNRGRHAEADHLYRSALDVVRGAGLAFESAVIQTHRVYALTQMGRYKDAMEAARTARRMIGRNNPLQLAQLETNVGTIYYRLDQYTKSLRHYDLADEILSGSNDAATRAFVDFSRSNVFTDTDRPLEALRLLERAAQVWEAADRKLVAAQARFHIAYIQFLRGNYNTALNAYYQVRDQLKELGSPLLVAWCNQEIAEILLALNSFEDAQESAALARESFAELAMPYESAQAAMLHALAAIGLKQFDEAQGELKNARAVFADSSNKMLAAAVDSYLAELALKRNDLTEAATRASSSFRTFSRQKLPTRSAYSRLLQARAAYLAGDSPRAMRMARGALASVKEIFAPTIVYKSHHLVGCIERDRRRAARALESFQRAVETIERMRGGVVADDFKATFLADKIEVYEDAIAACLDEGSLAMIEEAFRLVESSKSRALADLLARYARDPEAGKSSIESEDRARLARLIEDLNWYSSQAGLEEDKGSQRSAEIASRYRIATHRCERQIAQLFRRLEQHDAAFAEMQRMTAASVKDLRGAIERDETLIEYFTTGDSVSAFIATSEGIKVSRAIASKKEIEQALAALRFQIEKFNYGADYVETYFSQLKRATNEHLAQIYKMVFAPIESRIETERLIIIPHGALHYVPFHALYDAGRYLVERFEISSAPSASVLKLCRDRAGQFAFQCSDFKSETSNSKSQVSDFKSQISNLKSDISDQLMQSAISQGGQSASNKNQNGYMRVADDALKNPNNDLMVALGVVEHGTPSIEEEIDALVRLFPQSIKLTGRDATRENLLRVAPHARFLHLASHGYFRRDNPMFSFLKLEGSHLHFYSLLDLKLNAEMVTLSACHTGVNEVFPGDELHGLMRGFLYAGAPSLVASLWAVSDRSTAELMTEMYREIRGGATKRASLRRAQIKIKDEYGHPYYWAPFVLMGSPA